MEIVDIQYFSDIDDIKNKGFASKTEYCIELKKIGDDRIIVRGPMYRLRQTRL